MLKTIKQLLPFVFLIFLVTILNRPWGTIPALGKLLTPFHGYFQQIEGELTGRTSSLNLPQLRAKVDIIYDDLAVPHIFAQNDHDLYMAQGFIVARDRLWQMEFYTQAAAGRLTEIVGEAALPLDRYHRRIGIALTAHQIIAHLEKTDPHSMEILNAYIAGVNAYIKTLNARSLPLEYKILGYQPESWSPYKSILMLMNMRLDLSRGSDDYRMSNVLHHFGKEVTSDLFPDYPSIESPIIPTGTLWDFDPLPRPQVPDIITAQDENAIPLISRLETPAPQPEIGSNNWAVSGTRTQTGMPLLANDPHLSLTLPSIWYQIQLHSPDVNVYGVCLPGTPAVIIGFNKDIAWGVTNMAPDVMDFYRIQFKDQQKQEYWHNGEWKAITSRIDTLLVKGGDTILDTVYYSHHGPIVYHEEAYDNRKGYPVGHAMRWGANESDGSDLLTFHYLNRAKNYTDYRAALTYFVAPAQNFIFASNENDIAISPNGRVPLKWTGQGKFVLDGTLAEHDWQGWIPIEHRPIVHNPERGFVSSANQFPTDLSYPYYLGWSFTHSSRAIRINERLAEMNQATVESMNHLLNDNFNIDARRILPNLLASLAEDPNIIELPEYQLLKAWDYYNEAESEAASIFERWVPALSNHIWGDEFPSNNNLRAPSLDRTFQLLLEEPHSPWFDNRQSADVVETKHAVVRESFLSVLEELRNQYGDWQQGGSVWEWATVKNTTISHLVPNFKMFSRSGVRNGGGARIVNATSSSHGPSWRMVVQLDGDWPSAYGIYPGGQSGNPGSPYYDSMVDRWAAGKLDTLLFAPDQASAASQAKYQLTLEPNKPQ